MKTLNELIAYLQAEVENDPSGGDMPIMVEYANQGYNAGWGELDYESGGWMWMDHIEGHCWADCEPNKPDTATLTRVYFIN